MSLHGAKKIIKTPESTLKTHSLSSRLSKVLLLVHSMATVGVSFQTVALLKG